MIGLCMLFYKFMYFLFKYNFTHFHSINLNQVNLFLLACCGLDCENKNENSNH